MRARMFISLLCEAEYCYEINYDYHLIMLTRFNLDPQISIVVPVPLFLARSEALLVLLVS